MIGKFTLIAWFGALGTTAILSSAANTTPDPVQDAKPGESLYVGSKACKKCHGDQHKSWKKTKMATVFDVLKPGEREEAKVKAGLDPKMDYTKDGTCLPCHTTGYGQPGGYAIPPEGDSPEAKKAQKAAAAMEGVQCEACHGPGVPAVAYKKNDEQYKWPEAEKAGALSGMHFPTMETCKDCHNHESPFVPDDFVFDFEKRRHEGTHTHYEMDFKHDCTHEHEVTKKKKKK